MLYTIFSRWFRKIVWAFWWVVHIKDCPEWSSAGDDKVRYCRKCRRYRYGDPKVEAIIEAMRNQGR